MRRTQRPPTTQRLPTTQSLSIAIVVAAGLAASCTDSASSSSSSASSQPCDPVLRALFTPVRPQLGRYEVCITPAPLDAVARPDWKVEALDPLDAFGTAGLYDRAALARLYGGRRANVARGWIQQNGRFESLTLISPHPDATLSELGSGTLVIRYIVSE
jgi:hypothetical protein